MAVPYSRRITRREWPASGKDEQCTHCPTRAIEVGDNRQGRGAVGRLVTNWGPLDGPMLARDWPPALGVFREGEPPGMPIGIAFPINFIQIRRGPAKVFRLAVDGVDPDSRF